LYSGEFLKRHSSQWRLTDEGREQAKIAGAYIRGEMASLSESMGKPFEFYRHYVSEYIRAQETAARMELPGSRWFSEVFLRERDWGQMDLMSWGERVEKMGSELNRRDLDRFLFAPPGRISLHISTLLILIILTY
jgi:broad specificity phosphatase PhoE